MDKQTPQSHDHMMAITPESLAQLPPFVAALVNDYAHNDTAQHWQLRAWDFDPETLDTLPISQTATCEIFSTQAWVWRGCDGTLSFSPHLLPPDPQDAASTFAFAWIVERENESGHERITVWRIRVQQSEAPGAKEHPDQVQLPATASVRQTLRGECGFPDPSAVPLEEASLVNLAFQILEVSANQNLRAFLQEIWGNIERIDTIALFSMDTMGGEEIHSIEVRDREGNVLLPDLSLPYWNTQLEQVRDTPAVLLEQDLLECTSDEGRLECLNTYLRGQDVFKEMGLPNPKDESPFFRHQTRLTDVPLAYPIVYEGSPKRQLRAHGPQPVTQEHPDQTNLSATAPLEVLDEHQFFALASTFQRKHELESIQRIVEAAYGPSCGAAHVLLQGGELYLGGRTAYRHMDRLTVFNEADNELAPDLTLPFWRAQPDLDELMPQVDDESELMSDEYDDPEKGTRAFRLTVILESLIHEQFGLLPDEVCLEFDLLSEETQALLQLPFPTLSIDEPHTRAESVNACIIVRRIMLTPYHTISIGENHLAPIGPERQHWCANQM